MKSNLTYEELLEELNTFQDLIPCSTVIFLVKTASKISKEGLSEQNLTQFNTLKLELESLSLPQEYRSRQKSLIELLDKNKHLF